MLPEGFTKPVKVTVSDPDTGEVLEEQTVTNNYVVVVAGNRYIKHWAIMGKTHTISIAVRKDGE